MSLWDTLRKYSARRLFKVIVRSIHLVGIAGVFGAAMAQTSEPVYFTLAIVSGIVLVIMEAFSGWLWFVQLRGVALYVKLLLLYLVHIYPTEAMPCLITVIAISGFFSHAPSWLRFFSVVHGKVVFSDTEMLG
jgi:hypothetical protein